MTRLLRTLLAATLMLVAALLWADARPDSTGESRGLPTLTGNGDAHSGGAMEASYPGAPVERTGQTDCFAQNGDPMPCADTGQDGELRPGIVLPEPKFTSVGDGTVIDNLSGLSWLQDGGCLGAATWEQALGKVQSLNAGTDFSCSGYTPGTWDDWRSPNIKELVSLVDYSSHDPVLPPGHPFVDVGPNYWSSTTVLAATSQAFTMHMLSAGYLGEWKSSNFGVWAVRGAPSVDYPDAVEKTGQTTCYNASGTLIDCAGTGQDGELQSGFEWPSPRFIDRGDGTVSDELSGEVWLKDTGCLGSSTWTEALQAVHELAQGVDFSCADYLPSVRLGWRLPTVREVISLLDFGQTNPTFPSGYPFTGPVSLMYWTSSNYRAPSGGDKAYSVNGTMGASDLMPKTEALGAWAVRGGLALSGNEGLDPMFGSGGKVTTGFELGSDDYATDVVLVADDKIVLVGSSYDPVTFADGFALARYEPDGTLDTTFGTDGKVFTDLGIDASEAPWDAALQPDGKILVTGFYADYSAGAKRAFPLVRYNTDGSLDSSFGTGGVVISEIGDGATAFGVAVQSDGKIVVTGRIGLTDIDFALARYDSSGMLDPAFGTGGVVTTDIAGGYDSTSGAPVVLPSGKLLVAGTTGSSSSAPRDLVVARYNTNGTLDAGFGTSGLVITEFLAGADDRLGGGPTVQSDGKFVVAGYVDNGFDNDMAVARFDANGSMDTTFGINGVAVVDLGSEDVAQGEPVLDAAGNILISGFTGFFGRGFEPGFFALLRIDSEGAIDPTFWGGGLVALEFGGRTPDIGRQGVIQSDGKPLIIGQAKDESDPDFSMARLLEAPLFADGFESGGTTAWSNRVP